jgi:hypothetical protein
MLDIRYIRRERSDNLRILGRIQVFLIGIAILLKILRLTLNDGEVILKFLDECIPFLTGVSSILRNYEKKSFRICKVILTCADFNTNLRISLATFKGPSKSLASATAEVNSVTKMAPARTRRLVDPSSVEELTACSGFVLARLEVSNSLRPDF